MLNAVRLREITEGILQIFTDVKLGKSNIVKKMKIKEIKNGISVNLPEYAQYVDSGRKKGKRPPIKPIIQWLKRKKIKPDEGETYKSIAWAISTAIQNEGIKPRKFIENIKTYIRNEMMKDVGKDVKNDVKDSVKKINKSLNK